MITPDPDDLDEMLVYNERLCILLGESERSPTTMEVQLAVEDAERFRRERVD